jgi:hypothetical protein
MRLPAPIRRLSAGLVLALAIAAPASAAVLFESVADLNGSYDYSFSSDFFGSGDRVFDGFEADVSGEVEAIAAAVFFLEDPVDITVEVFSGLPNGTLTSLFSQTFTPGDYALSDLANGAKAVSFAVSGLTLSVGQTYTISFYNPDTLFLPGYFGGQSTSYMAGEPLNLGTSTGFRLEGDAATVSGVPEPGAWLLMILGFGGTGALLRRSRGRAAAPA